MKRAGRTPPFRGPDGQPLPDSIAEVEYLRLGGVDQWVMTRGERVSNPVLILLHGGPGFSDTQFFRHCNAALERSFTIVYWDQRGTGKSFNREIPRSAMTVDRFVADLDELIDHVRRRLGQNRVALFGHSWGSAVGALYTARFPDNVSTYIGCAQIGDSPAAEAASYAFAVSEAQRLHNRKALKDLQRIGAPPYAGADAVFTERTSIQRLNGELSAAALWKIGRLMLGTPESSLFDLPDIVRGFRFSMEAMWNEVSKLNLLSAAPVLRVPVFFFHGRRDHWIPGETSLAYFDLLSAPSKTFIWFDDSGHEPFVDEPAKFNTTMTELVRPVADRETTERRTAAELPERTYPSSAA
jgi:pimeloyl-ACP methyl ester carboxylesterase